MPELVDPDPRYQESFLAAAVEVHESDDDDHYAGLAVLPPVGDFPGRDYDLADLRSPTRFATFTDELKEQARDDVWRPQGIVAATVLWWVEGSAYLGRVSVRHSLTPWLRDFGGHVGYVVRPTARLQGHASAMLAAALPVAASLGIDPALVTCDDTNVGSRKVIEANGGVFENQRGVKLRFWVPTS